MSAPSSEQAALVAAAPALEDWSFGFLTEAAQRAAVSKLCSPYPAQGMLDFEALMQQAKSPEIREQLQERQQEDRDAARSFGVRGR
jgi:hypothetical protein